MKINNTVPLNEYVALKLEVDRLSNIVMELSAKLSKANVLPSTVLEKGIVISAAGKSRYIKVSEIVMIKAESNYSTIHLQDGSQILTSKTLKYWEEKCNASQLYRVHKSYVINTRMIDSFEASVSKLFMKGGHLAFYSGSGRKMLSGLK